MGDLKDLYPYLHSFPTQYRAIFRDSESTVHNCNNCHNFIKRYGNVVAIINGQIVSMFSVDMSKVSEEYLPSITAMNELVINSKVKEVFFETFNDLNLLNYGKVKKSDLIFKLGISENHKQYTEVEANSFPGKVNTTDIYSFHHFAVELPRQFVNMSGKSIESIMAEYRDKYNVFKRGMTEISLDTFMLVKDLILQNSLLNGESYLGLLNECIKYKERLESTSADDNWFWTETYEMSEGLAKFRNTLLGTLCVELTEGKELNEACLAWNKRADPANYMKATAPITQKQRDEAVKRITELGYEESFERRFATINDIDINEILHVSNNDSTIKTASVFDKLKPNKPTQHKRAEFDKVEEVSIDKFMKDILPTATGIELFLENKHLGNMCVMTTSENLNSKGLFKYSNNFSKTFKGNLAGKSLIKDAVKGRGGKVDTPVRVSIHFPLTTDDYDLHCCEPNRNHIYYSNRRQTHLSSGVLDLDAQGTDGQFPPEKRVENLTYSDISKMPNGTYHLKVNNYSDNSEIPVEFSVEVEINGDISTFTRKADLFTGTVSIGFLSVNNEVVTYIPDENMIVLESKTISIDSWGVSTNHFHKVNLVCLSPNFWGENAVGNKHYMFMLEGCKADTSIRSFHNEDLNAELREERKVLEVFGNALLLEPDPSKPQLAGLGFNSTVRDEVVLKISGSHKRMIKVKF